jgi:type VI secretion system secreted protein VgrG
MAIASSVTIEIAGNRLPDFFQLTIHQRMFQPHDFTLVIRRDVLGQSGNSSLSSIMDKIGSDITFSIQGIDSGTSTHDLFFKGIITGISSSEAPRSQEIILTGHSPDILLNGYPSTRSFDRMTLQQIAQDILSKYPFDKISLTGDPDNRSELNYITQYHETDYEFLSRLARRYGQWFFHDGSNLVFGSFSKTSVDAILGINLSDFQVSANLQPMNFQLVSFGYGKNTVSTLLSDNNDISGNLDSVGRTVADKSGSTFPGSGNVYYPYADLTEEGERNNGIAPAKIEKEAIASRLISVNGTSGEPVKLGNVLSIKTREGGRQTEIGDYLVTGLTHSFDNSMNYRNSFTAIPSASTVAPNANIRAAAVSEAQPATVTDNNDPQKLGRVKVQFSWHDGTSSWIRVANAYAGNNRGIYFVPEIGTEVLVGFEGGDPDHPYVIGSFYNGDNLPDDSWPTGSNDKKIICTNSGHKVEFDDSSGGGKITVSTAGGNNQIVLSLSPDKITIQSQGDIEIKGNNIKVDAQGTLDFHATSGITIKADGGNVSVEGTATTVKGTASAEISSNGSTTVKGSLVQIN